MGIAVTDTIGGCSSTPRRDRHASAFSMRMPVELTPSCTHASSTISFMVSPTLRPSWERSV
eukprot:6749750-Prymnesium_polylepis.1